MEILLINIDSKLPNIALHKIEKYYLDKGDNVTWDMPLYSDTSDKIYVSCIFTKNRNKCTFYEGIADIGGTGYDIHKRLPKEIEDISLKINYGFTTRGCVRKCSFCFVPEKEGNIHVVGDLYDIWDGKSKEVVFLDNNILALPEQFKKVCEQSNKEKLEIDFNQGMDIRFVTEETCELIKQTKFKIVRFAFDSSKDEEIINRKIRLLNKYNVHAMFYVLVGFESDFSDALKRINYLIKHKQRAYVMKHENCDNDKRYMALARWCNSPLFGKGTLPFKTYLTESEDGSRYIKYFKSEEINSWQK